MMVTRNSQSSFPVINLDKRIVNEAAFILLGYIVLASVMAFANRSLFQVVLAVVLAVFGSGLSTVAVLFPRSHDLDIIDRAALSACLSLAIGGIFGFALTRSPWGLHIWPFLVVAGSYSFVCWVLIWYRRRNLGEDEIILRLDSQKILSWWKSQQSNSNHLITAVLILFLISGAWVLARNLGLPHLDPPMSEFFVLGKDGQTEAYPKTGHPGERLMVTYGIVNRENSPASYQVKAFIQGEEIGIAQPVNLLNGETQTSQIEFKLLDTLSASQTKVEFVLYREEKPYRFLHLWIDIVNP